MHIVFDRHGYNRKVLMRVLAAWPDDWNDVAITGLVIKPQQPLVWCLTAYRPYLVGGLGQECTTHFHGNCDDDTLKETLLKLKADLQEKNDD